MKSDIEIAQAAKLEKISSVADKLDIPQDSHEPYGHYKAKISMIS
jgi:Formyltetrahydrofolate synthetase